VSDYLSSPLKSNVLDSLRQDVASSNRTGQPETAALYEGILNDLLPYQKAGEPSVGELISAVA
jgi:hypothetical protein